MTNDDEFSAPPEKTRGIGAARRLGAPVANCDRCGTEFVFDEAEAVWVRFWAFDSEDASPPKLVCSDECAEILSTNARLDGAATSVWRGDDLRENNNG